MTHQSKRKSRESEHTGLNKWLNENTDCETGSLYHHLDVIDKKELEQLRADSKELLKIKQSVFDIFIPKGES